MGSNLTDCSTSVNAVTSPGGPRRAPDRPISPRVRRLLAGLIGFGPGLAWFAAVAVRYRASPDRGAALALGAVTAVGVVGLSGVFLAWFPYAVERFGLRRFGAWLRRWWDEDAR